MKLETLENVALEKEFNRLAGEWKEACGFLSSTSAMTAHPAYQAIIEMGHPIIPYLLRDLKKESAHWFEALKAITGEDPVPREDWGNISAMSAAWLNWGRTRHPLQD